MAGDVENFPPAIQWIIYAGTAVGVTIATIIGGRKRKRVDDDGDKERERIADLVRQVERGETTRDIDKLRREFTQVIDIRLADLKRDIIHIIDDKLRHGRGRSQE